jgi:hypothetical protein
MRLTNLTARFPNNMLADSRISFLEKTAYTVASG